MKVKRSKKYLKENLYGALLNNDQIYINVPLLYKNSETEEEFITNFSKVITHEVLHKELLRVYKSLNVPVNEEFEEDLIDVLSGTFTLPIKVIE